MVDGRACTICFLWKPRTQFTTAKNRPGLRSWCKACTLVKDREYRRRNPEKYKTYKKRWARRHPERAAASRKRIKLKQRYGLSWDEYLKLTRRFAGACWICLRRPAGTKRQGAVDHDHTTGKVRGFLCDHCNRGLGFFAEETWRLRAAIAYLNRAKDS